MEDSIKVEKEREGKESAFVLVSSGDALFVYIVSFLNSLFTN